MKTGKRLLALLLTALIILSVMSVTALAETSADDTGENEITGEIPVIETSLTEEEEDDNSSEEADALQPQEETVPEDSEESEEETEIPEPAEQEEETEISEGEVIPEELEQSLEDENAEPAPVKVTFACSCKDTYLDVYSDTDWFEPEENDSFTYLLMPGEYRYSASCDGYVRIKSYVFTVAEGEPEQTVEVRLTELGDAFAVLYCDAALAGHDFKDDYLNSKKSGGMLLMATLAKASSYSTPAEAGSVLKNTITNQNKGYLITELTNKGQAVESSVNNGAIKISYSSKRDQDNWNTDLAEIYNSAFAHSISDPTGGDYIVRGRMVGLSAGYDSVTWDGTYYTYDFKFLPYMTDTAADEANATQAASALVSELDLKNPDKTDYEKLCSIYSYITQNVTYCDEAESGGPYSANVHSAYAALCLKNCVCQGYATMLYRLCLEAGIDCRSAGIQSGHEWNIVKIDGKWYFVDSTWDAGKSTWGYFLKGLEFWRSGHRGYYYGNLPSPATCSIKGTNSDSVRLSYNSCTGLYSISSYPAHAVFYELDGGTNNPDNPYIYTEGTSVTLKNPTKENYTFIGWYTDAERTRKVTSLSALTEDITLYAAWGAPVEITFNPCGGSFDNDEDASRTVVYGKQLGALPTVRREGYKLLGWYSAPEGGNKVASTTAVTSAEALTYYARWSVERYTITYKFDGGAMPPGTANPSSYTVETRDIILYPAEKVNYTFRGWYADSSFTHEVTSLNGLLGNLVLYAKFTGDEYYIHADYDTDTIKSGSPVPESYFNRQKTNITLPTLAKEGYSFKGWYDLDTGSRIMYILRTSKRDYNIEARFTPKTYRITYSLSGGALPKGTFKPTAYTIESADIVLPEPQKTGYSFEGWYDAKGNRVEVIASGSIGTVSLTARYSENSYTIQYDKNGGEGILVAPISTLYSKYIRLYKTNYLGRDGYKFSGWNTKADGTGKTYGNGALTRKLTGEKDGVVVLYAKWTPVKYTIRYVYSGGRMPIGVRNPSSYTFESSINLNEPVRKGYTFLGWFDSFNRQVVSVGPGKTGNLVLTARWEKN